MNLRAPVPPDLRDAQVAVDFYESRFRHGYMGGWPPEKIDRVKRLLTELPLPEKGRALDFGCGTGVFTSALVDSLPGWDVVGIDISVAALDAARKRETRATFEFLEKIEAIATFDLVFTHHVLEHVPDIQGTAEKIESLLKPAAAMLHILPCGDPGSLEHSVCISRKNGIDEWQESRFFHDEEGHLRRLTTDRLVALWTTTGFAPGRALYANQRYGALNWLTETTIADIGNFADPAQGVDAEARRRLRSLRMLLLGLWWARKPIRVVRDKMRIGLRSSRDVIVFTATLPFAPFSAVIDWTIKRMAAREWERDRSRPGSEMYVFLTRAGRRRADGERPT